LITINQKEPVDVENFQYLGSLTKSNDIHGKLCPGLPCPERNYKRRTLFYQQIRYIFEEG